MGTGAVGRACGRDAFKGNAEVAEARRTQSSTGCGVEPGSTSQPVEPALLNWFEGEARNDLEPDAIPPEWLFDVG